MKYSNRSVSILIFFFLSILLCNCAGNIDEQKPKRVRYYSKENAPTIDLYRLEAAYQVNKKWNLPKNSECADNKSTYIVFTILPNGEVKDVFFTDKSECKALDDSAYSAIIKAAPFKPFPKNLKEEEVKLGLRLSPDGVR